MHIFNIYLIKLANVFLFNKYAQSLVKVLKNEPPCQIMER